MANLIVVGSYNFLNRTISARLSFRLPVFGVSNGSDLPPRAFGRMSRHRSSPSSSEEEIWNTPPRLLPESRTCRRNPCTIATWRASLESFHKYEQQLWYLCDNSSPLASQLVEMKKLVSRSWRRSVPPRTICHFFQCKREDRPGGVRLAMWASKMPFTVKADERRT
jgi:hypothetical protein